MWNEIVILFTTMDIGVAILLCLGLAAIIIEMFLPGFGIFGGAGIIMLILGVILQIANSSSGSPLAQFIIMICIIIVILCVAFFGLAHSIAKGKLKKTPFFRNDVAVPQGITEGTINCEFLLGQTGVTTTPLRPAGFARFDGRDYDVMTKGVFIESGATVEVKAVEGAKVFVEKTETDRN